MGIVRLGAALAAVCAFAGAGQAASVNVLPGTSAELFGTTNDAEGGALAGAVLTDNLIGFTLEDYLAGTVQNRVTLADSDGTLTFAPRIRDIVSLIPALEFSVITGFSLTGYGGAETLIEYRTDGLGDDGPESVSRSADGDVLTFRFDRPALDLTEESYFLSIDTDATAYALTGTMTIFGRRDAGSAGLVDSVTITGLAVPEMPVVPVPASAWLLLGGLGLLVLARWRRRLA